jgi:hypothetical protein|tara:strand:+ start:311 stop:589 length:279 start_codon:yes stop_codon:yes gene_type:complete
LKIQQFLQKGQVENVGDVYLHTQLFAYRIAKHYNISLGEVYNMSDELFTQSLAWAMAVEEEQKKDAEVQRTKASTSQEVVSLDYDFLNAEDF